MPTDLTSFANDIYEIITTINRQTQNDKLNINRNNRNEWGLD
jgi:hypothetical protein